MINNDNFIYINNRLRIPLAEINVRFSYSSGPGGQHANKVATKVTLIFDVADSPALQAVLSEQQHARLIEKLASRLDSSGQLQVSAQDSRSQYKNRETAVARLKTILAEALQQPKRRRPTKRSRAAQERRLEQKKQRGRRKQERSRKWDS